MFDSFVYSVSTSREPSFPGPIRVLPTQGRTKAGEVSAPLGLVFMGEIDKDISRELSQKVLCEDEEGSDG